MSFSLDTDQIPFLSDYAAAFRKWQDTKPWRGDANGMERPLDKRSKKHVTIRKAGDDIICRLYRTDLVTYKPDGHIEVCVCYNSQSTERMINALLGRTGVWFNLNRGVPVMWYTVHREEGRGYVVDGGHAVLSPLDENRTRKLLNSKPIKVRRLNVRKATAVRKQYGYDKFVAWRNAYEAMKKDEETYDSPYWRRRAAYRMNNVGPDEVIAALRNKGEAWVDLAKNCDNDHIVQCIYKCHPDVIDITQIDSLQNYGEYANIMALDRKYGWAI